MWKSCFRTFVAPLSEGLTSDTTVMQYLQCIKYNYLKLYDNLINSELLHNALINLPRLITKSNIHFVLELFDNTHCNIYHSTSINIFVIFSTQLFCRLIIKKKAAVLWMLISVGIYQIYYVYSNRTVEWKLHWDPDVVSSP